MRAQILVFDAHLVERPFDGFFAGQPGVIAGN
jgi:hypothetical protein